MSDPAIYQRILDVDIAESSGVPALLPHEPRDESVGYVVVNEMSVDSLPPSGSASSRLFPHVHIPDHKAESYRLARALFDHYNLRGHESDEITPVELAERAQLLDVICKTPPMVLARDWISARLESGRPLTDAEWRARVEETWFDTFTAGKGGSDPTRSGFEHVFLGEWNTKRDIVGGFHWWYFYYNEARENDIRYNGARYGNGDAKHGVHVPEIVTCGFDWEVENDSTVLGKKIGGFFVGPSVEGLMAIGMVRAAYDTSPRPPRKTVIAGMEVDLALYTSQDKRSVNTFYPIVERVLAGTVKITTPPLPTPPPSPSPAPPTTTTSTTNGTGGKTEDLGVRIISVMANPEGHDAGRETVTVINMYGAESVSLEGWRVHGPNDTALVFGAVSLGRGAAMTATSQSLQLGNKGGAVQLRTPDGGLQQAVRYSRDTARKQGGVLLWDGKDELVLVKED